jgi:NAD+ synthase
MTMQNPLRITMAQINPHVGDIAGNAGKILSIYNDNKNESDLIIFPELCLSGYQPEDLVLHDGFMHACMNKAEEIAKATQNGPAMVIGSPWLHDNGDRQNCALFLNDGKIQHIIAKYELPNYGVFDEVRVFTKGNLAEPVEYKGHKLGIAICEDLWFPTIANHLKEQGAEVLISLNGSPFEIGKDQKRLRIIGDRVCETGLPAIYINQVGGQDEVVYDGGSFVMDSHGEVVAHLPFFEEKSLTLNCHSDEGRNLKLQNTGSPIKPKDDRNSLIYSALKLGLKDYVEKNGFPGVLLGLSGGIDSALSAVIAVDALGPTRVQCVMMPSPYTSQESLDDAAALANNLGCAYDIMDIQPAMDAYHSMISDMSDIALENIQSRARGMVLMALSNTNGKMVLSTGNKSEMAVGYATLYGDMCGGFNVLKDVYKTQVYELSKWRNDQGHIMPDNIITRPASAELRPDQTDQDSLPPYDILDDILEGMIEHRLSISEIVAKGHDLDIVKKVRKLLDRAEYKRRQAPPGVKITKNSFGRERRMPITNGFEDA